MCNIFYFIATPKKPLTMPLLIPEYAEPCPQFLNNNGVLKKKKKRNQFISNFCFPNNNVYLLQHVRVHLS